MALDNPSFPGRRGQQTMTVVLLTGVILTVSFSAYFWGREMLDSAMERRDYEKLEEFMIDLNENIKEVARRGGRKDMRVSLPEGAELRIEDGGPGQLDNITVDFQVSTEMMETGRDLYLLGSGGRNAPIGEDPESLLARAEEVNDMYSVEFKLYYRNTTVNGEDMNRIGIEPTGSTAVIGDRTDIIIERGERKEINGFVINTIEVRMERIV